MKLTKGQTYEKKITNNDINKMNINELNQYIGYFHKKIINNEISFYI